VQHRDHTDLPAQASAAKIKERFTYSFKEIISQNLFVGQYQSIEFVRQREYQMEVFHRQEFGLLFIQPLYLGQRLALGAVPITAGVIGGALIAAGVTLLYVTSQGRCTAAFYGLHDLEMRNRQRMSAAKGLAMGTKDIGQFNAASCRCQPLTGRQHGLGPL
jgi:hypothetical protein